MRGIGTRILGLWMALSLSGLPAEAQDRAPLLAPPLVEAVRIEGIRYTSEQAVRELLGMPVGQPLDAGGLWAARRRLLAQGWYRSVDLQLARGEQTGAVVVVLRLRELEALALRADFSSFSEGILSLGARFQPPGKPGFSADAFLGEDVPGYAVGLDVPAIFGSRLFLSARAYHRGRERLFPASLPAEMLDTEPALDANEIFQQTGLSFSRTGLSVELGRPLGRRSPLSLTLGHRLERLEGDNRNGSLAIGGESRQLAALSLGLAYTTLDPGLFPGRGRQARLRLTLAGDALGSDYGFTRLTGQAEQFLQASRRLGLRLHLRGGALSGQAPFSEHFFAEDLVRGYSTFTAAGSLGSDLGLGGGLELGIEPKLLPGLRRMRVYGFADLGGLWSRPVDGGSRRATAASAGLGLEVLTGFGAIGFSVPVWVKDVELPEGRTLPLPIATTP